jgi:RNA polymerase sigma-70 factor, ECF subfamily
MAGNDADAHDALQEALIAITRGLRRFDGRAAFGTWAYRVATNACLDELRRRRRRPVPGALGDGGSPGADGWVPSAEDARSASTGDRHDGDHRHEGRAVAPVGAASRPGGDGGLGAVADRLDLDACLARLPGEFRVAVVLRDVCDLDYAEIARVLNVPVGTVRSRIARGRARLADLLGNPTGSPDRPTTSR